MTLTIELAPEVEQQLSEVAARQGQDPASFAKAAVEEKLWRVAQVAPANGAVSNGSPTNGELAQPETTDKPLMLDKVLAGLTGVIHSNDGRGGARLSEMSGADFGEDLARKHSEGNCDAVRHRPFGRAGGCR